MARANRLREGRAAVQVRRRVDRLIAEREGYDGRLRSVGERLGEEQ